MRAIVLSNLGKLAKLFFGPSHASQNLFFVRLETLLWLFLVPPRPEGSRRRPLDPRAGKLYFWTVACFSKFVLVTLAFLFRAAS